MKRRFLDLLAMLVGASQEMHIKTVQPLKTRHGIRRNHLIGVTQMRAAVHIGNSRGNVVRLLCAHLDISSMADTSVLVSTT